jgi:hypothetical protein
MKNIIFLIASVMLTQAHAAAWGEAGCGLGSVIIGTKDNQIIAATSNGLSENQTFGITSGTSNCTEGGSFKGRSAASMYIDYNKIQIAKDAARGNGETLATLGEIYGCKSSSFTTSLKNNYQKIFVDSQLNTSRIESQINDLATNPQVCGS